MNIKNKTKHNYIDLQSHFTHIVLPLKKRERMGHWKNIILILQLNITFTVINIT